MCSRAGLRISQARLLFCGAHPVRMRDAQAGGVELGMGASLVPARHLR